MTRLSRLFGRSGPAPTDAAPVVPAKDLAKALELKRQLDQLSDAAPKPSPSTSLRGLDTSRLPDGTVVMSVASPRQALDFADACVRQNIRRVVDLRSAAEKSGPCPSVLDGSARLVAGEHGKVTVRHMKSRTPLLSVGPRIPARDAHTRRVSVGLSRNGKAVPGTTQDLSVIRMPVGRGRTIAVDRLFDVCLHLAHLEAKEGGVTVFQSADGGHDSATFAVARSLVERCRREEMLAGSIDEYLLEECAKVRGHHRPDVFRAEDLASLREFAKRLVAMLHRGELLDAGLQGVRPRMQPPSTDRLPGSILKRPRSGFKVVEDGGAARQVRLHFDEAVTLRRLTDTVHEDGDDTEVTRTVEDEPRRLAGGAGTRPPRSARKGQPPARPDARSLFAGVDSTSPREGDGDDDTASPIA
ncbi:MAG: hypothetical protein EOP37_03475 [Rubrivivax sp.]|nr:MAG: hypothetical protein EOP37_03475 [Rubrivivax sp.]